MEGARVATKISHAVLDAREAFFAQLPRGRLSAQETELLKLLQSVASVVESLLPRSIGLQEWAERRIPKDAALSANASGLVFVSPRQATRDNSGKGNNGKGLLAPKAAPTNPKLSAPVTTGAKLPVPPMMPPPSHPQGSQRLPPPVEQKMQVKFQDTSAQRGIRTGSMSSTGASAFDFFETLPQGTFLPQEDELRTTLRLALKRHEQRLLSTVESREDVLSACEALLPEGVRLTDWIEMRMGSEIVVNYDDHRQVVLHLVSEGRAAMTQEERDAVYDEFFSTLPSDCFIQEEENLRDALLYFMDNWQSSEPPRLTLAGMDPSVKQARWALLPEKIALKVWCETRIGGEIDLLPDASGQFVMSLPGQLNPGAVAQLGKRPGKRKAGE